jgi:hypothetical protein
MSAGPLLDVHREALARLRTMGMNFAERLHAQAQEPEADVGDLAVKFARVSRAVRQSIFLEARLADDERRRAEAVEREKAAKAVIAAAAAGGVDSPSARPTPWETAGVSQDDWLSTQRANFRGQQAYDAIEQVIQTERGAQALDRLTIELADRIDSGLDEARFASQAPIGEVIAMICRELGFKPDWSELSAEDTDLEPATLAKLRLGRYDPPPDLDALPTFEPGEGVLASPPMRPG